MFNPLCSAKPVSLTTSLNSWGKVICCLCAGFHVALTPVEAPCHCQLATPSEATPFSYWSIKPWFYYQGKTCCCAHHTFSLGVPNSATLINLLSRLSGVIAHIRLNHGYVGMVSTEITQLPPCSHFRIQITKYLLIYIHDPF